MSVNFWFTITEGLKGFKRARMATGITMVSIALALFLVGLFILSSVNINKWIGNKRAKIELEVYLEPDLKKMQGKAISRRIAQMEGVAAVYYVSKNQAAERFKKEFGQDIYDVLDSNPLPPSCTVRLKKEYSGQMALANMISRIKAVDGVNDVVYEKEVIALINHYVQLFYIIIGGMGFFLILISVVLLYNTIRLTVLARKDIIEILKLVGATPSFIRRPFLIEGFLQGLLGAVLASGLLYIMAWAVKRFFYGPLLVEKALYPLILFLGAFIGYISSKISLAKYLKRV